MLKDKRIYEITSYLDHIRSNKVSPHDAYVNIKSYFYDKHDVSIYNIVYLYPFLYDIIFLTKTYLSKLGFYYDGYYDMIPVTALRYVTEANYILDIKRLVVEVAEIDTVAVNTNLPRIVHSILGTETLKQHSYFTFNNGIKKIIERLRSQKLFEGYDFDEAGDIVTRYYTHDDTSLAKDVKAIREAYNRIFQPYRVVYDLKNKQPVQI